MSRKVKEVRTRVAGEGASGDMFGVTRLETSGKADKIVRRKPCPTCPWRKDAAIGAFPAEAFRISANTAYDGAMATFSCHESGAKAPATCAGFLLANSANNIGVRIALSMGRLDMEQVGNPDDVPLFESYRAMAIANGVCPDDPRIAACRGDDEEGYAVAERVRQAGAYVPRTATEHIERMLGDDDHDL